jgi:hypothetical protein
MKVVLGTLAAAMLVGAVWAQPAEARCFWNGYATVCTHHGYGYGNSWRGDGWRHHGWDRGWHRGWDRGW